MLDIGAVTGDGREFHSDSQSEFAHFIKGCKYICGHNILNHDLKYLQEVISKSNVERLIDTLTPSWVLRNYPRVENILRFLRNKSCNACDYCADALSLDSALTKFFGFKDFRSYNGNPLQRDAVRAAGWDDSVKDMETRVKTSINALE